MRSTAGDSAYKISQSDRVRAAVPKIGWRNGVYTMSPIMTKCASIPNGIHLFLKGFEDNAE